MQEGAEKKEKLKDEDFKIITEIDRKKQYLRAVSLDFKQYESNVLKVSVDVCGLLHGYLDYLDNLQSNTNISYAKLQKCYKKYNVKDETLDSFFTKVCGSILNSKEMVNFILSKVEEKVDGVDFFADQLHNILMFYSSSEKTKIVEQVVEEDFNECVANMEAQEKSLVDNLNRNVPLIEIDIAATKFEVEHFKKQTKNFITTTVKENKKNEDKSA